jgi:hypothetical protein
MMISRADDTNCSQRRDRTQVSYRNMQSKRNRKCLLRTQQFIMFVPVNSRDLDVVNVLRKNTIDVWNVPCYVAHSMTCCVLGTDLDWSCCNCLCMCLTVISLSQLRKSVIMRDSSCGYCLSFLTNFNQTRIFPSNTKFHKNPGSRISFIQCRQTDGHREANS